MSSPRPTAAEILQRFYDAETIYMAAAPQDRDFANGMGKHLCKDMKLVQSPDLPYGGTYKGHTGFQQWTEAMASYFDRLDVTDPQLFEQTGSDTIIVKSLLKLQVRKTGEPWEAPLLQVVRVDREREVITEITPFYWDVGGLSKALREDI